MLDDLIAAHNEEIQENRAVRAVRPASAHRWPVRPGRTDEQGTNQNSTVV